MSILTKASEGLGFPCLPERLYQFITPPAVCENVHLSVCSPLLSVNHFRKSNNLLSGSPGSSLPLCTCYLHSDLFLQELWKIIYDSLLLIKLNPLLGILGPSGCGPTLCVQTYFSLRIFHLSQTFAYTVLHPQILSFLLILEDMAQIHLLQKHPWALWSTLCSPLHSFGSVVLKLGCMLGSPVEL